MIKKAELIDLIDVTTLAILLWPDYEIETLKAEMEETLLDKDAAIFLYCDNNLPIGFAQCQLRKDYVDGTNTSPVGYLEGIFVTEEYRNKKIAKQLLKCCENWSMENGCTEFGSDCELDNDDSYFFHLRCGFQEANRTICFYKKLKPE